MAPRRGGGSSSGLGGSSGSSSVCRGCGGLFELPGSGWQNTSIKALFAIEIIVCVVLIACLFLVPRFQSILQPEKEKRRRTKYRVATCSMILYLTLDIVDIGLSESGTRVMYWYYLVYMFESLGWRIGELLILAIIFHILREEHADMTAVTSAAARPWSNTALIILGLLSTAAFGLVVTMNTFNIIENSSYGYSSANSYYSLDDYYAYITVAYEVLYTFCAILIIIGFMALLVSKQSNLSKHFIIFVAPSLFLRPFMTLLSVTVVKFGKISTKNRQQIYNLNLAAAFITTIALIGLFLGVAIIARRKSRSYATREVHEASEVKEYPELRYI